jgi:flagellar motor switch protein FliN/FliY
MIPEDQPQPDRTPEDAEAAIDAATQAVVVEAARLDELQGGPQEGESEALGLAHLMDVPVRVTVEVGRRRLSLAELSRLGPGSLVVLDREAHEPADILVNGKVVAYGEIVTIDGSYGVRVTRVLQGEG